MKKKLQLIGALTAAAMIVSSVSMSSFASAAETAETAQVYASGEIDENFESVNVGEIPSGWYKSVAAGSTNSVGVIQDGDNKVLCLDASQTNKEVRLDTPVFDFDKLTVSYKIKFDNVVANQNLLLAGAYADDNKSITQAIQFNVAQGAFRFKKSSADNGVYAYAEADKWYDVKLLVDNTTNTVEFWIDNNFVKRANLFRNQIPVKELIFLVGDATATKMYIDDLKVQSGCTFGNSVEFDFNNAVSNEPNTFYPAKSGVVIQANNSADTDLSIVNGKFGKSKEDSSLYINNKATTSAGKDFLVQADLTQTAAFDRLNVGETAVLDARVAFDESMSEINLKAYAYSEETTGDGKLGTEFIQLKNDGTLTVFGQATFKLGLSVKANEWYDIHLEINAGDTAQSIANTYQVWFNGQALNSEPASFVLLTRDGNKSQSERSQFQGLQKIWLNHNFTGKTTAGGFYADDLRYTISTAGSLGVPQMTMTSSNETLNKYINYPYGIFADDSVSLSDIKNINVEGGSIAAIRDANGDELTDVSSLENGYVDLMPISVDLVNYDCRHIYLPVRQMQYSKKIDGADIVISEHTADKALADEWVKNAATEGTDSYTAKAGIGQKANDDYAFQIVGGDAAKTDYLNYALQGVNESMPQNYMPMTMEYSFYIEDNTAILYTLMYFDGAVSGEQAKLAAKSSGGFLSYNGSNPDAIADLKSGWNRLAVTTYPGHNYVDLYLNGTYLGQNIVNTTYHSVNMIRFAIEKQGVGKVTAFDDIEFYTGVYKNAEPVNEAVYYSDAALTDSNGNQADLNNVSAGTYTYKISNVENKTSSAVPLVLFAAVYDSEGKVQKVSIADMVNIDAGASEAELNVSITVPEGLTNAQIRIFTWNSVESLIPVSLVKSA